MNFVKRLIRSFIVLSKQKTKNFPDMKNISTT